ncbi:TetR family transcriptional regulator [Mesorhizobium sp. L-8-10]|uniref:TetR/AcrR family transcriptional regulator n=1 Tax=unclassified Mesorhizobium TaxID=325217 RepID=UPI00192907DA|nr:MULTISPECIES: TetR/AcrR family transcriptional regulator [unclassified Mesorhizobium]BCH26382.1 TetR family transcriptional regulator [Mesorhizobium sp. L-8-3]BCH34368.1 TetR family transcriptional regulator [Mesorhizobium sp. L-8-10]
MPQSTRIGRPPKIENARQRILDHAARLFAEKGYETSSLAELAERLGLTKPALYNYFASKQELYDAIILVTLSGLVETVTAAVACESSPSAKLRRFMMSHARYFEAHHDGFVAMLIGFGGMDSMEFRKEALALRNEHEHLLRAILADGVEAGAFRTIDPVTASRAILSLLNWMARWFKPGGGKSAEQFALDYFELLALERTGRTD